MALLTRLHRSWLRMIGRLGIESGSWKSRFAVFCRHLNTSDPVRLRRFGIDTAQALVLASLAHRSLPGAFSLGCSTCRARAIGPFSLRALTLVLCNLSDRGRCRISRTYQAEADTVSTFLGPLIAFDLEGLNVRSTIGNCDPRVLTLRARQVRQPATC